MRRLFALAICLAVLGLGTGCDQKTTTAAGTPTTGTAATTTGTGPTAQ